MAQRYRGTVKDALRTAANLLYVSSTKRNSAQRATDAGREFAGSRVARFGAGMGDEAPPPGNDEDMTHTAPSIAGPDPLRWRNMHRDRWLGVW
jgi:hypothetical protein